MVMAVESVKIDTQVMDRLRKYVARKTDGRMYGQISKTIEAAIEEYLNKREKEIGGD